MGKTQTVICNYCKTDFEALVVEVKRGNAKFCSLSCCAKYGNESRILLDMVCKHCGNKFKSSNKNTKYCSNSCKQKNYRAKRKHTSNKDRLLLNKIRDLPCEICGWNICVRDVHHIKSVKDGGKNEENNLISLCPNHHRMADYGLITEDCLNRIVEQRIKNNSDINI